MRQSAPAPHGHHSCERARGGEPGRGAASNLALKDSVQEMAYRAIPGGGPALPSALRFVLRQPAVRLLATRTPVGRKLAGRFVAGETLDDAIDAIRSLNAAGMLATIDHLGENVSSLKDADAAVWAYLGAIERIAASRLNASVSLKLTQLGLDLDEARCVDNLIQVLAAAAQCGLFVRVDMEGSAYTQRTVDIVRRVHMTHSNVGAVIQSALYRSGNDVRLLNQDGIRVRLCKGAYQEPADIAYPAKADVDRNYLRLAEALLLNGEYPAIATHDERIIKWVTSFADALELPADRFEFQMLYGVRRDLQSALVASRRRLRVYVPFGAHWYPYLSRRLAERPANLAFFLGSLLREARSRR